MLHYLSFYNFPSLSAEPLMYFKGIPFRIPLYNIYVYNRTVHHSYYSKNSILLLLSYTYKWMICDCKNKMIWIYTYNLSYISSSLFIWHDGNDFAKKSSALDYCYTRVLYRWRTECFRQTLLDKYLSFSLDLILIMIKTSTTIEFV